RTAPPTCTGGLPPPVPPPRHVAHSATHQHERETYATVSQRAAWHAELRIVSPNFYVFRHATCLSAGESSLHFFPMNGCSLASKFPPRSISAASALSRKYGCVDDGTQEIR